MSTDGAVSAVTTDPATAPVCSSLAPCPSPLPPSTRALLLPAAATGGLLWLCHFPVAWGWLAWIALVPMLCLVRAPARSLSVAFAAWVGGLLFFVPILQWMRVADPMMYFTWIALALYCSLYLPAGVLLVRWLDRRTVLPLALTLPAVWTALEYLRAHLMTGFAWYFLGHTQHAFLPVIQIADVAGVYGVTFVVAAVNAVLFELLCTRPWFRGSLALPEQVRPRPGLLAMQTAVVVLLLAGLLGYGCWRLGQNDFARGPRLALLQGDLEQGVRNARNRDGDAGERAMGTIFEHYVRLCNHASRLDPALIVWPETSYPYDWEEIAPDMERADVPDLWRQKEEWSKDLPREAIRAWRTDVLLGLNTRVLGRDGRVRRYNSALLIQKRYFPLQALIAAVPLPLAGFPANFSWPALQVAVQPNPPPFPVGRVFGRYDKMHLVPYGEYVPLRDVLPLMNVFSPYDFDYSVTPGEQMTRFPLGPHHFGVLICYEDTDPLLARQYVCTSSGRARVDFLLNTSNDGWFNGTSEHEEHLAICRFRAIECRRSVLRAVNMGISAVIDPNGRVLAPTSRPATEGYDRTGAGIPLMVWEVPWMEGVPAELSVSRWHEFKKVQGVLTVEVPIDFRREAFYARRGDDLPRACWLLIVVGVAAGFLRPALRRLAT